MHAKRLTFGVVCALSASIGAQSVTIAYDNGTTNTTTAISGFTTGGDDMAGMSVTAFFTNSTSQNVTYVTTGINTGAATGTGWSLSMAGSTTFGGLWTLRNTSGYGMTRLLIDAGPGDTVFDTRRLGDIFGTPGSARGWDFTLSSGPSYLNILATYRDQVALTGNNPVGDLFRKLDIQFRNTGGLASGDLIRFIADTDNILFAGDINAPPEVTCNTPVVLWAPDHTFQDVSSAFSVSDPDDNLDTVVVRVFSDENEVPDVGDGSGKFAPDFKDETTPGGRGLLVRAERQGKGDGRYYVGVITATDTKGAVTKHVCVLAVVPHDQNDPTSLDNVLAEASAAAAAIATAVANDEPLPIAGTTEHGLSDPLGPKQ